MSDVIVSVVVQTFNRPDELRTCLASLRSQTFDEPQEVVEDDNSPELPDVGGVAAGTGAWCRVIRQANADADAARNSGVRKARGHFVAFTDDDCKPKPEWLEALVRAARTTLVLPS
jgi:glycosyltransferase involved in cell wall biosynthesis